MLTASSVLITLGVAATLGIALTLYVWHFRRRGHEAREGLAALAGMRWREFSGFVVDALQQQGFEADRLQTSPQKGQAADLRLVRDGKVWLLACKQGLKYRIDARAVADLAEAVRFQGAEGGVIATLGQVGSDARRGSQGLQLLDGPELWALVEHRLPAGLHDELVQRARRRALLELGAAWVGALVVGALVALLLAPDAPVPHQPAAAPASNASPAAPAEAAPAAAPAVPSAGPAPADEAAQREMIRLRVDALPGVRSVVWSTRSTLLVNLAEGTSDGPATSAPICDILGAYPDLRASRLQLQPAEASGEAVRFMQCHSY